MTEATVSFCIVCGKPKVKRKGALYCSPKCRVRACLQRKESGIDGDKTPVYKSGSVIVEHGIERESILSRECLEQKRMLNEHLRASEAIKAWKVLFEQKSDELIEEAIKIDQNFDETAFNNFKTKFQLLSQENRLKLTEFTKGFKNI